MIELKNIYKRYKNCQILKNVSLKISQGEIVGLLGPNGSGKTTSFHTIIGMVKPDSGKILLNNQDITKKPSYQRSKNGIGFLSQNPSIFNKLTVEENILCILEMHQKYFKKKNQITEKLIQELGLQNVRKNLGKFLSEGERRRTEIARCLSIESKFILLDEPFSGIDPITIEEIKNILFILKKKNIGILITDHNVQEILKITDRIYIINNGKILKHGIPSDIIKSSLIKKIYLGNFF